MPAATGTTGVLIGKRSRPRRDASVALKSPVRKLEPSWTPTSVGSDSAVTRDEPHTTGSRQKKMKNENVLAVHLHIPSRSHPPREMYLRALPVCAACRLREHAACSRQRRHPRQRGREHRVGRPGCCRTRTTSRTRSPPASDCCLLRPAPPWYPRDEAQLWCCWLRTAHSSGSRLAAAGCQVCRPDRLVLIGTRTHGPRHGSVAPDCRYQRSDVTCRRDLRPLRLNLTHRVQR